MGRKDRKKIPWDKKLTEQVEAKPSAQVETWPATEPVAGKKSFQDELNALPSGASQQLWPQEYAGPIIINHPITIEGNGATIWALKGPVVSLKSPGVVLRNVKIECTGEDIGQASDRYALLIEPGLDFELKEIEVRGLVKGIPSEEGEWRYPLSLSLGVLLSKREYQYRLRLVVPVACRIMSTISGLEIIPQQLVPGINEVVLHIENLPQDILISGLITIKTDLLKRSFSLCGTVNEYGDPPQNAQEIPVLWEPEDWAAFVPKNEELQIEHTVSQDEPINPKDSIDEILTPLPNLAEPAPVSQKTREITPHGAEKNPVPVAPEVVPNDENKPGDGSNANPVPDSLPNNESGVQSIPLSTQKTNSGGGREIPFGIPTSKPVRIQQQFPSSDVFRQGPPKGNPEEPLPKATNQSTIFPEFLGNPNKPAVKTGVNQSQSAKEPVVATNGRTPNHQNLPKPGETKPDKNPNPSKRPPGIGSAFGVK